MSIAKIDRFVWIKNNAALDKRDIYGAWEFYQRTIP